MSKTETILSWLIPFSDGKRIFSDWGTGMWRMESTFLMNIAQSSLAEKGTYNRAVDDLADDWFFSSGVHLMLQLFYDMILYAETAPAVHAGLALGLIILHRTGQHLLLTSASVAAKQEQHHSSSRFCSSKSSSS